MTQYFINYDADTNTITVNTFRHSSGYMNFEVDGLVEDIMSGNSGSCRLDGALDAVRDGSLWDDSHQDVLEMIDSAIYEFYDNNPEVDDHA